MPNSRSGTVRVLGIDTSLRSTGVAVVEATGNRLSALEHGAIRNPRTAPLSKCLRRLDEGLSELITRTGPDAAAIEGAFYSKNVKTAMILGEARGVAIAACARAGLPVYEYAPRRIKQALVGIGSASKNQVRQMVMTLLSLDKEPQEDAGDALAIAICHLHTRSGHAALAPGEI
ncbi:crossover junction endodeoxyribonuclease RuvC [Verrucomicrobiota bacterium]